MPTMDMMRDFGVTRFEMKWGKETPPAPLMRGQPIIFLSTIALWPFGHSLDYWIISHPGMAQKFHLSLLATGQLIARRILSGLRAWRGFSAPEGYNYSIIKSAGNWVIPSGGSAQQCAPDKRGEHTEIAVAKHYNSTEILGLYPGMVPKNMRTSGQTKSWTGSYQFWKKVLVDELNFPFVKVSHGFLDLVPENKQPSLFVCNSYQRRSWLWLRTWLERHPKL